MNKIFACVAALVLVAAASSAHAQVSTASALYFPGTGNIELTLGSNIGVAGFEAMQGIQFNAAATGNLGDTGIAPAQKDATILAYFSATGLPGGVHTIAGVLPTGLGTPGQPLTQVGFSYSPIGVDPIVADLMVVPEPATLAMAGLGLVGAVAAIRRRK